MVKAKGRYLPLSAQKLNAVAREVRGLLLSTAEQRLAFMNKKGAKLILKVLKSAASNALSKSLNRTRLVIHRLEVGAGTSLKRGIPVSRGVFHPIIKRRSHVLIELREEDNGTKS